MTYAEAIGFLNGLRMFGANFGLDTTRKLAALAGDPHARLRFIHVAGTNGKGSTCAMLKGIYRASWLRVGLFTSPHLVSFRERIQVNRQLIGEADVARLVGEMRAQLQTLEPTFFEFVTVMALRHFAEQKCDLVIWETGLGGRLDSTNIVTPLASVITNISFDHQQWLGDTLAKIAAEKAGILKPGVPAITATDEPEALEVIRETARRQGVPLTIVGKGEAVSPIVSMLGEHQRRNAALALATVRVLQDKIPVSEIVMQSALALVQWPGRLQVVRRGAQTLLLDGAHNPAGAITLRTALRQHFPQSKPVLVLGILRDKDWRSICEILAPLADAIFLVPVHSERTSAPDELRVACESANPAAKVTVCGSLAAALEQAACAPFVVITGSLYLVGEALERLNLSGNVAPGERDLNEWAGTR